jgi:hypothetical protein
MVIAAKGESRTRPSSAVTDHDLSWAVLLFQRGKTVKNPRTSVLEVSKDVDYVATVSFGPFISAVKRILRYLEL